MRFNKKYHRVGTLFQGIFKAVNIDNENYLLWLTRYIHRNPENFTNYPYSSYDDYLQKRNTAWINKSTILDYFSTKPIKKAPNYQDFVESEQKDTVPDLDSLILESEDL